MNVDTNNNAAPTIEEQFLTPEQLIQPAQASEAPADQNQPADQTAAPAEDPFIAGLRTHFGEDASLETLKSKLEQANRLPTLEEQVRAYEAQKNISPFVNPLAERVNTMLKEGKSVGELADYFQLSAIDVSSLPATDAIRRQYALANPGVDPEIIEGMIERKLGFDPTEPDIELSRSQKAALYEMETEAKTFLKSKQISVEPNLEAVQAQQAEQAQMQRIVSTWEQTVPALEIDTTIKYPLDGDAEGSFVFQPSPEAVAMARQIMLQTITNNPSAYPPTRETAAKLQENMADFLFTIDRAKIITAVAKDAAAKATEAYMQRVSGNGAALNRPQGQRQNLPTTGLPTQLRPEEYIN